MGTALEIPAFVGEFLPVQPKFQPPTISKSATAEDLVKEAVGVASQAALSVIEAHVRVGTLLAAAQERKYEELTGEKLSQETNERRGQIASISKQWRELVDRIVQSEHKRLKDGVQWAAREMQWARDFPKALALLERRREYDEERRGSVRTAQTRDDDFEDADEVGANVQDAEVVEQPRPQVWYDTVKLFREIADAMDKTVDEAAIEKVRNIMRQALQTLTARGA